MMMSNYNYLIAKIYQSIQQKIRYKNLKKIQLITKNELHFGSKETNKAIKSPSFLINICITH